MAHFAPAHPALVAHYGRYPFSGPEDAYDPEFDEERRQAEAERDMQGFKRVLAGTATALAGGFVGTKYSSDMGVSAEGGLLAGVVAGWAVGYFGLGMYYAAQNAAEGVLSYEEYGG
jgi:hypothetical protein